MKYATIIILLFFAILTNSLHTKAGLLEIQDIRRPIPPSARAEIGPDGGVVEVTDPDSIGYGARIEIPEGAVANVETFTITVYGYHPQIPNDWVAVGPYIKFWSSATLFKKPVKLFIPYNDENRDGLLDGTEIIELELRVCRYDASTRSWKTLKQNDVIADVNQAKTVTFMLGEYLSLGMPDALPVMSDQSNVVPADFGVDCGQLPGGVGSLFQSFTPMASTITAMDLRLKIGGSFPADGYETFINVRADSPTGPIVGSASATIEGPKTSGEEIDVRFNFSSPVSMSAGDLYVIEWISPQEGGSVLSWMAAENNPYLNGNAFGCSGAAVEAIDFLFTSNTVKSLSANKEASYEALIQDQRFASTTGLAVGEDALLMHFVRQLEYKATSDWEALHRPEVDSLSMQDLRTIWLRRLAVTLYHEANQHFPWSIFDYDQRSLDVLLGFNLAGIDRNMLDPRNNGSDFAREEPDEYWFRSLVWAANPMHAMVIMHIIKDRFQLSSPQEALFSLVDYQREQGWHHGNTSNPEWEEVPFHEVAIYGNTVRVWNIESHFMLNQGGSCGPASGCIREIMRAFNIPVIVGGNLVNHTGLYTPSLDLIMVHGDDIYAYPQNLYPAQDTFRTRQWYENFIDGNYMAVDLCEFYLAHEKKIYIDWFKYYRDPVYRPKLEIEYCNSYVAQQGYFYDMMTLPFSTNSVQCDWILGEDPDVAQWLHILSLVFINCD